MLALNLPFCRWFRLPFPLCPLGVGFDPSFWRWFRLILPLIPLSAGLRGGICSSSWPLRPRVRKKREGGNVLIKTRDLSFYAEVERILGAIPSTLVLLPLPLSFPLVASTSKTHPPGEDNVGLFYNIGTYLT